MSYLTFVYSPVYPCVTWRLLRDRLPVMHKYHKRNGTASIPVTPHELPRAHHHTLVRCTLDIIMIARLHALGEVHLPRSIALALGCVGDRTQHGHASVGHATRPGPAGFQYLPNILEPSQFPLQEELFSYRLSIRWGHRVVQENQ